MGKRSSFELQPRSLYHTPPEPVQPLAEFVDGVTFCEPMAGRGDLIRHLQGIGAKCKAAYDIEPVATGIYKRDALKLTRDDLRGAEKIITNPVWDRAFLHPAILHFTSLAPTWLLFDSDWAQTIQAGPFAGLCKKVVAVGRVKWFPGTKHQSIDNCSWYFFSRQEPDEPTRFYFRGQPGL